MSTLERPAPPESRPAASPDVRAWTRLAAWTVAFVVAFDLVFVALVGEVIPALAIGAVLMGVSLLVVRWRPRPELLVLGVVTVLLLAGGLPFVVGHFGHPASGFDFGHAVIGVLARLVIVLGAFAGWRGWDERGAGRLAAPAIGLAALVVVVGAVATLSSTGDERQAGDTVVEIRQSEFPAEVRFPSGASVYVDNQDLFRHTFTVEGTGLSVDLPARVGTRFAADVAPGTYRLHCDIPGHESMEARLVVD